MKKNPFNTNKKSNKNYALLNGLIVDIEIPRSSDTSLMVKNGRFCEFMW